MYLVADDEENTLLNERDILEVLHKLEEHSIISGVLIRHLGIHLFIHKMFR